MPTRPKISREMILNAALEMVSASGYASINIKNLAKQLHCSTQPISWHFGNMEGLRRELSAYAAAYAKKKLRPTAKSSRIAFTEVGMAYINLGFDEPNLFRFLYMGEGGNCCVGELNALTDFMGTPELAVGMSKELNLPVETVRLLMQNIIIYTHGIVSYAVAGVMKLTKGEVMDMVRNAGITFLISQGADPGTVLSPDNRLLRKEQTD